VCFPRKISFQSTLPGCSCDTAVCPRSEQPSGSQPESRSRKFIAAATAAAVPTAGTPRCRSCNPAAWTGKLIFRGEGTRWFHTGGIFCALSGNHTLVAKEALKAARDKRHRGVL